MDFTSSLSGSEPAAPATPPSAPQAPSGDLPVDQLAQLAPVRAVIAGKPGAVYAPEGTTSPLAVSIGRNFTKLGQLGLGIYRSPNKVAVMFNPSVISPKDLVKADKEGKLDSLAVPLDSFDADAAPQTPQQDASAPAPQPLTKGLTPRAQSKLAGTRIKALEDDELPSDRPVPGGGRILNSLLGRAV